MIDFSKEIQFLKYASDPALFIKDIIGLKVTDFHKEWLDLFENNRFISILAPRGHGKSSILSGYLTWKIVTNPNIRILIVTLNQDMADRMMSVIQKNLEKNEKLISIFGKQRTYDDWSRSSLTVAPCTRTRTKESTVQVVGITASMVGGHYDIIVLDDIVDDRNSKTKYRRNEIINWYNQTLTPMVIPKTGKIIIIGTRWHQDDFYAYVASLPSYTQRIYKALIEEPKDDKEAKVLWPEMYPYEELMKIKRSHGNVAFMMQYQNTYVSDETAPIKWEWINDAVNNFRYPERPYSIFIGVDLASKGEESDYFAMSVVALKDGVYYLIDGFRGKLTMRQQFDIITDFYQEYQPIRIGVEQAAQQKIIVDQLIEDNPSLPIVPIKSSVANDRMSRVQRLSVLFESKRITVNKKLVDWIDELSVFPRGAHDDTIDSLSFAIQVSNMKEKSKIDWYQIPDLIYSKKTSVQNNEKYRFTKV